MKFYVYFHLFFQELKNFSEYFRDINQLTINADSTKSLCAYFEGLNSTFKQFELMLYELDAKHSEIKSMRINFESINFCINKLIAKGNQKHLPLKL